MTVGDLPPLDKAWWASHTVKRMGIELHNPRLMDKPGWVHFDADEVGGYDLFVTARVQITAKDRAVKTEADAAALKHALIDLYAAYCQTFYWQQIVGWGADELASMQNRTAHQALTVLGVSRTELIGEFGDEPTDIREIVKRRSIDTPQD